MLHAKPEWWIYTGSGTVNKDALDRLPPPPRWRAFASKEPKLAEQGVDLSEFPAAPELDEQGQYRGRTFRPDPEVIDAVNAALYLRRPLLVTGIPGTGKSSLAYSIAYELDLGQVLYWPINTRSTIQEALYRYDALARLHAAHFPTDFEHSVVTNAEVPDQTAKLPPKIGRFMTLGPLGTALLPYRRPRVLLIDEIDKSDIDLPNDLLNIFEEGKFEIPELMRLTDSKQSAVTVRTYDNREETIERGLVQCLRFPFVVLTSNNEREFPSAFLRRCVRLNMREPDAKKLKEIVNTQLKYDGVYSTLYQAGSDQYEIINERIQSLINGFLKLGQSNREMLATDHLLNAIYMLINAKEFEFGLNDQGVIDLDQRKRTLVNAIFSMMRTTTDDDDYDTADSSIIQ